MLAGSKSPLPPEHRRARRRGRNSERTGCARVGCLLVEGAPFEATRVRPKLRQCPQDAGAPFLVIVVVGGDGRHGRALMHVRCRQLSPR